MGLFKSIQTSAKKKIFDFFKLMCSFFPLKY